MPDILLIGLIVFAAVVGFVAVKYLILWRVVRSGALDRPDTPNNATGGCVLLVITIFWSAITLTADIVITRNTVRQLWALGYEVADGDVRSSRVTAHSDDEGTSYDVEIEYGYRVGDAMFTGTRVRYVPMWGQGAAAEFVAAHAPGTRIAVYYDPGDPADAVLLPGVGGQELFVPLFLLPFNLVMAGLWASLRQGGAVTPFQTDPVGGAITRGGRQRVRLAPASPSQVAVGVLLVGSFVSIFPVGFCAGMPPSAGLMVVVWVVVLGVAAVAHRRQAARVQSGRYDLVVDRGRRKVVLPATFGRGQPVAVPLADLREVRVVEEERKDGDGDKKRVFVPTVVWQACGAAAEGKLAEWEDYGRAERLADWLRRATGLAVTPS
jgi:hypothetical protein